MPTVIRFQGFEIGLESGDVKKGGVTRSKLQDQPLQVLAVLVERPGELVSREQLRERLWPDDVHIDYDTSLNKAILKLRNAFGDSPSKPQFIETIPRHGYRFVGSLDKPISTEAALPGVTETGRGKRIAVGVAALMVIGFVGFHLSPSPEPVPASDFDPAPSKPSLAILPFQYLDPSEDAAPLGLGMADTLITKLSNVSSLTVRPTSAVVGYPGESADSIEFGRKLGVDHVLEGTLQREGDRVRVSLRLLRVQDEQSLWAEVLEEEEVNDLFELQDRVSEQVAAKLSLRLTSEESARLAKQPTPSFEAYEQYMRGRYFFEQRSPEPLLKAVAAFERATELDPKFALAYAGIAYAYAPLVTWGDIDSAEGTRKMKAAVLRALELDDSLAEVHTAVGLLHGADWNWEGEEGAYQRAIELNPNFPISYMWYGFLLESHGRFEESLALRRKAWELDPTGLMTNVVLGDSLHHAGRLEEAVAHLEKTLELAADFDQARISLGDTLMAVGDWGRAADLFEAAGDRTSLACVRAQSGATAEARAIFEELQREAPRQYLSPYHVAAIHASLGETELAFAALEEAYAERIFVTSRMNIDWRLAPIKNDPRFSELARRVGLTTL